MSDVLDFRGVSVVRDGATLLDRVDWQVSEGERWVVLGANGAGKTTLLQLAAANLHPSRGRASILGETLGAVDVFELRPRIGLSSAALADRLPAK
jgi:iron complex transport system ATP-binding protein